ncbi:tRNA pseudouridine(38/39) synthase [Psilocybe cubensis]|uniref:tRNA pseudouridine(38/39) synthase n=2 Tax=Psilocybe cubensis TaxID=181762 RepID=A0ACB8GN58_PSICU|nr:tRNA pseudouridine(38/39) synthase [Psilocybe cubensis]KAH9476817.1 tRNA pseudouridine(38/39) synthase [Psilocybe cubensis]
MPATATSSPNPGPYAGWTRERLIERLTELEGAAADVKTKQEPPPPKISKTFDFSKYSRRKIALKFCYSGWEYGGLAFQMGPTPLPTVENVLFDALAKTRLIDPEAGFEGCGWEKCGRTDRGVSAGGQVVSLWVRSALPSQGAQEEVSNVEKVAKVEDVESLPESDADGLFGDLDFSSEPSSNTSVQKVSQVREHDYLSMINRLLPDTIRVTAWSPVDPSFSARFSCKYRHYKYFFSSLHLDIPAMQAAAARMMGEHDFRNLCKLDAQKQITNFRRTILRATIEPLESEENAHGNMYVFDLVGTAFLYHQVRHIMAILFLVGSGLEPPRIVTELMNAQEGVEDLRPEDTDAVTKYEAIDRKPEYQMADALPLMLWECGYDESALDWQTSNLTENDAINGGLYRQLQAIYNRSRVFSALDDHFIRAAEKHHPVPPTLLPLKNGLEGLNNMKDLPERERYINIPLGGGTFKRSLKYVPLLKRKRLDTVEAINERWRISRLQKDGKSVEPLERAEEDDGNE